MADKEHSREYSEKWLERKLNEEVKKLGGMSIKLLPFQLKGLPDRMLLMPTEVIVFVEVKTTGKKLKPMQLIVKNKLERLGFAYFIISTKQELNDLLDILRMLIEIRNRINKND